MSVASGGYLPRCFIFVHFQRRREAKMGIFKLCSILKNLERFYFRYLQKLAVNSFATYDHKYKGYGTNREFWKLIAFFKL